MSEYNEAAMSARPGLAAITGEEWAFEHGHV